MHTPQTPPWWVQNNTARSICSSPTNTLPHRTRFGTRAPFGLVTQDSTRCILVSMTRITKSKLPPAKPAKPSQARRPGHWLLQDAKARFSELVRKVRSEGPQHVTVHGRDEVVVIAAEEFRRLKGGHTGQALIDAIQSSPYRDAEIEPARSPLPIRDVLL